MPRIEGTFLLVPIVKIMAKFFSYKGNWGYRTKEFDPELYFPFEFHCITIKYVSIVTVKCVVRGVADGNTNIVQVY